MVMTLTPALRSRGTGHLFAKRLPGELWGSSRGMSQVD